MYDEDGNSVDLYGQIEELRRELADQASRFEKEETRYIMQVSNEEHACMHSKGVDPRSGVWWCRPVLTPPLPYSCPWLSSSSRITTTSC